MASSSKMQTLESYDSWVVSLIRMRTLMPKLLFVYASQAVMAWLFYRSSAVVESDWIVFGIPFAIGFVFSAVVLFRSLPVLSRPTILALASSGALIASFVGTVIGFNMYGT